MLLFIIDAMLRFRNKGVKIRKKERHTEVSDEPGVL